MTRLQVEDVYRGLARHYDRGVNFGMLEERIGGTAQRSPARR